MSSGKRATRQKQGTTFLRTNSTWSREEVRASEIVSLATAQSASDSISTVPCLRRAASLAYTDADEDAERLVNVSDSSAPADGDEWVETHAGRKPTHDSAAAPGEIEDIPDLDGPHEEAAKAMANLSISGGNQPGALDTPDMDEIPDMEEDLEGGEDEATAAPATVHANQAVDARCVSSLKSVMVIP